MRLACFLICLWLAPLPAQSVAAPQPDPAAPPADAVVLFDGTNLDAFRKANGAAPTWVVADGAMEVKGGDIFTRRSFRDYQLHFEFLLPPTGNSNSGVKLHGVYEIQVIDSYGKAKLGAGDCGAIYSFTPPPHNACLPRTQWQTYDIIFRAPRFDGEGKKIEAPRVTVLLNGVWLHHDAEVPGVTGNHPGAKELPEAPVMFQDHGAAVRYRNVWLRELNLD